MGAVQPARRSVKHVRSAKGWSVETAAEAKPILTQRHKGTRRNAERADHEGIIIRLQGRSWRIRWEKAGSWSAALARALTSDCFFNSAKGRLVAIIPRS